MKYEEYAYYSSEISQLERLLSKLPEERSIERMGLRYQLSIAKERIEGVPIPPIPQTAYVTFSGKPVTGHDGIDANFSATAVGLFTDAVAIAAAGFAGDLRSTGPVPRKGIGQPVITGVAVGSFGFEMELPGYGQGPSRDAEVIEYVQHAVEMIQELLTLSSEGSDNDLSEIADDMHPRAVRKVGEFLEFMKRSDARFALEFREREFRIRSTGQLEEAIRRLAVTNIYEETNTVIGIITGVLPSARRFELNRLEDGSEIEGRLGREIRDPHELLLEYMYRQVKAEIRSVRVGQGKPRYTLVQVTELTESPE